MEREHRRVVPPRREARRWRLNPTIAKYREGLRQHPGLATIVDSADLTALLDIAEAAQTFSCPATTETGCWFNVDGSLVTGQSFRSLRAALARLNGDKA